MTTVVPNHFEAEHVRHQSDLIDDADNINDDNLARMSEALKTAENLDQFLGKAKAQPTTYSPYRHSNQISQSEGLTPATGLPLRGSPVYGARSPRVITVNLLNPNEHLDSSDEDECTFQPRVNASSALLVRNCASEDTNENLYKDAADRRLKAEEYAKMEQSLINQHASSNKLTTKSMKIVLEKLQKSLKNLIGDVEAPETPGEINFEGLGSVLNRLGIFQNLEFSPNHGDGEKSSLSINHARVKPERLAKEIAFHENMWGICAISSVNTNLIFSDLVLKMLLTLLEDKTTVNESATLLLEILDAKLESLGLKNEKEKFTFHDLKEEKNLWSMERLVLEFRRLFNDKTGFMNTYGSNKFLKDKNTVADNGRPSQTGFKPEINKKSIKLDSRSSQVIGKKLDISEADVQKLDQQERNHRLYNYHGYIKDKKTAKFESLIQEELSQCTFSPRIKNYKDFKKKPFDVDTGSYSPRKTGGYFSEAFSSTPTASNRHLLLYEVAKTYKEKLQQKTYALKKKDELDDDNECTHKPKVNNKYHDSPVRKQDFYDGVPNGFKKNVERMHKADEMYQSKKVDLESIPRGENYEKNKAAEFKPPQFITRPKIKKDEVLVYVDVSIGAGKTGRIGIHKGDNPKLLAVNFARTYSLNANMRESLEKLLKSYIESYFAQNNAAEQATDSDEKGEQDVTALTAEQQGNIETVEEDRDDDNESKNN